MPVDFSARTGLSAPTLGRDQEKAQFQAMLDALLARQTGSAVLITGEPGIGKSRLLAEFKRVAAGRAVCIYEAGCVANGQAPYDVFVRLVSAALGVHPEDDARAARARVETALGSAALTPALADVLPYIEHLIGIPIVDPDRLERICHLDAPQLRRQTFMAVRDLFVGLARQQPLALMLEDLHWIDKPSLDLLLFLFNSLETVPLVLLCAARPTDNDVANQVLRAGRASLGNQFLECKLGPLSLEANIALVGSLLAHARLPEGLPRFIAQRAEGNPFLAQEIIHLLIDRQVLVRPGERWELTAGAGSSGFDLPSTLEGVIMARVDLLPESTRHLLQCAAVIGQDFERELLTRVMEGNDARLAAHLQDLVAREFIVRTAEEQKGRYSFRHALIQQTVYNALLMRRREHLHQRIARAIQELEHGEREDPVGRLAFHYSEAQDAPRALPCLLRAGDRAAAACANEQALEYYRSALDMANHAGATLEQRIQVLRGLADEQDRIGDYGRALASFHNALELERTCAATPEQAHRVADIARRLGRVCALRGELDEAMRWLESALYDINRDPQGERAVERVRIYLEFGAVYRQQRRLDEAQQWLKQALSVAQGQEYYPEMATALDRLAELLIHEGDWAQARDYALRGLAIHERIGDTAGAAYTHLTLGVIAASHGEWSEAAEHLNISLELNQRLGEPKGIAEAFTKLGGIYVLQGDAVHAREYIRNAQRIAEKFRQPEQICAALNALGEAELLDHNWSAAADHLQASIQLAAETGARERLAYASRVMAEAQLGQGKLGEAERSARHALQLAQETGSKEIEASAYRVLGAVERASLRRREAEIDLSRAIGILNDLKSQLDVARAEFELALLYEDQGLHLDARSLLQRCLDTYTRFNVQPSIERAEQALNTVRARTAHTRP